MNENLFRTQFDQLETTEKQALMERLAARYNMTFLGLHTFDRWGQNCTTGIFEKDSREYVFVPGDTVTLGWERFAIGLSQDSREELDYLFQEWERNNTRSYKDQQVYQLDPSAQAGGYWDQVGYPWLGGCQCAAGGYQQKIPHQPGHSGGNRAE